MASSLDVFAGRLSEYDVSMRLVEEQSLESAIGESLEGPSVAVPFDRFDVDFPETVTVDPTPVALRSAVTGITPAEFAVGEYGSIVLAASGSGSELVSLFVDKHVAVLSESDLEDDMPAAYTRLGDEMPAEFESAVLATGPSATADMGALVEGAHGPREVELLVVED